MNLKKNQKEKPKRISLSVGMKILFGVALTSNICIGGLVYAHLHATSNLERHVENVLEIRRQDSEHLRETIVGLQNKMLSLSDLLKVNLDDEMKKYLKEKYELMKTNQFEGRDSWKDQYTRSERRDLGTHKPVIKDDPAGFSIAFGIYDESNEFTENLEQRVYQLPAGSELVSLQEQLLHITRGAMDPQGLQKKLKDLDAVIADEALNAEKTRTEIIDVVEMIEAREGDLAFTKDWNEKLFLMISLGAFILNLLVILALIRIVVEKPLRVLIRAIDELRSGGNPEIPWQNRTDQIGILSGTIKSFKDVLFEQHQEAERKKKQRESIDRALESLSLAINSLEGRARGLDSMSIQMETLAGTTNSKSAFVALRAESTATHTLKATESTDHLRQSVNGIQNEIYRQSEVIKKLGEYTRQSRVTIDELTRAAADILTIVSIVHAISDQTKLLALNATIEAARSGQYGQGFGVVAREVKELSYETVEATGSIDGKIKTIERVCERMSLIIKEIEMQAEELQHVSTSIESSLERQSSDTETIARIVEKTSENTVEVSTHIQQVRETAADTMKLSAMVKQESNSIARALTNLLSDTAGHLQES